MKALCMYKDAPGAIQPILKLTALPIPKVEPGSVLVKVIAAAVNPSDVLNSHGGFPYTTYPRVPGRDFAGIVESGHDELLGSKVFASSGRYFSFTQDGCHAEYCTIPIGALARMPPNLSFAEAATIGVPFSTAQIALDRAATTSSDIVLVIGASGAVGGAAIQLAKLKGCTILTAARNDAADINLLKDPSLSGLAALTNNRGPDVIIDAVGDPVLMRAAVYALAPRGRISYISSPRTAAPEFTYDMKDVYRKEKSIIGCNSLNYSAEEIGKILQGLTKGFEAGLLRATREDKLVLVRLGPQTLNAYEEISRRTGRKFVIVNDGLVNGERRTG